MIRFALVLFMSLALSSQAIAAVKWNNSGNSSSSNKQELGHYSRDKIPLNYKNLPLETARFYFQAYNGRGGGGWAFTSAPSETPRKIESVLQKQTYVANQLAKTSLVSYMVYEKGKLIIDELSPNERFGDLINEDTLIYSMSLGKSLAGYMIGHAICQGHIESIEQPLSDWPLVADTLISELTVRDVINATMGNQGFMMKGDDESFKSASPVSRPIKKIVSTDLKGTKPGKKRFEYGALPASVALNYISYKTGHKFKDFSNSVLRDYVKLSDILSWAHHSSGQEQDGIIHPNFNATRSDTLRIGIAILEDWNSNSCVGKYLKDVYSNGVKKNPSRLKELGWGYSRKYAGFFHTDYKTVNANVMGMDGYGGISMLINFDDNRIVYAHAVHRDYDHKKLIFEMIRTGKID